MDDGQRHQLLPPDAAGPALDGDVIADLRSLEESAGEGFLAELAHLFLADSSARIASLHEALDAGDARGVFGAAHTLAGSSANLGASRLSALCSALADLCRGGDVSGAPPMLEMIDRELARVEPAVRELIAPP